MRRPPRIAGGSRPTGLARRGFQERAKVIEKLTKTGYNVSDVFPWWKTGIGPSAAGIVANTIYPAQPVIAFYGSEGEQAFKNDTDGIVEINRLTFGASLVADSDEDVLSRVMVKMSSDTGDIIKKWLPITTLHSDPYFYIHGEYNQSVFVLPTPYFMQAQYAFTGRIFAPASATLYGKELTICLRGYNPIDYDPIVMATTVNYPAAATSVPTPFSFTENRDGPLRDMVIEEISFGLSNIYDELNIGHFSSATYIQFFPPSGPKWSEDILSGVGALSTQINVTNATGNYFPAVIHEPITPIILEPGQSIQMKFLSLENFQNGIISCTALGVQRGRRSL